MAQDRGEDEPRQPHRADDLGVLPVGLPPLLLASGSPRRRALLASLGLTFDVRAVDIDEFLRPGEDPFDAAERLGREKALAAASGAPVGTLVVAADTLVVLEGKALGKPRDREESRAMLRALAGRPHGVVSGVAVARNGLMRSGREITTVIFGPMSESEIERYAATGEPDDKAGAYALQGIGGLFVERVDGSPSNVVGLPVRLLYRLAQELGIDLWRQTCV